MELTTNYWSIARTFMNPDYLNEPTCGIVKTDLVVITKTSEMATTSA